MEMNTNLLDVLRGFRLDAEPVSCEPYGCGHINVTYLAVAASGRRYILQRINHHAFRDIPGLMENITAVTEFLRAKANDPRGVLTLVKTHDGASFLHTQDAYAALGRKSRRNLLWTHWCRYHHALLYAAYSHQYA